MRSHFRSTANNQVDVVHTGLAPSVERGLCLSGLNSAKLGRLGLVGADSPMFVRASGSPEDTTLWPPSRRKTRSPNGERVRDSGEWLTQLQPIGVTEIPREPGVNLGGEERSP